MVCGDRLAVWAWRCMLASVRCTVCNIWVGAMQFARSALQRVVCAFAVYSCVKMVALKVRWCQEVPHV